MACELALTALCSLTRRAPSQGAPSPSAPSLALQGPRCQSAGQRQAGRRAGKRGEGTEQGSASLDIAVCWAAWLTPMVLHLASSTRLILQGQAWATQS